jgi:predicted ATPase/DNA-binding CsgD family transcriptional regulator
VGGRPLNVVDQMPSTRGRGQRGNLPADLTSFIGRHQETSELKRLLEVSRLVTVTGVGGIGKTRLALRAAAQLRRAFPGDVWFVELGAVADPELVAGQVGLALGLRDHSGRSPAEVLLEYLGDKQTLLVIDNCEHVLDATALLIADVLKVAPQVRILATSRQRLGITGEHVLSLSSLSLPDGDKPPPLPEAFAQYEALILFVERAEAAMPGFAVTPANHAAVVSLCRALDGMPLAIELAAVRLRMLSPEQVLARLDDRFTLLASQDQSIHPRQRNLHALIDWSFELCSPPERALWMRLSVFPGAFDLDAAIGICTGDGLDEAAVLDALTGLLDRSLLVAEPGGRRRMRYRALDTIREYGRLAQREDPELIVNQRHRHYEYFLHLAKTAEASWCGPDQREWVARLGDEHDNLRTALEFSLSELDDPRGGLDLAGSLWVHWLMNGLLTEGRHWLDRLLAVPTVPSPARAKALWCDGYLRLHQGDIDGALAQLELGSRAAEAVDDDDALAHLVECKGTAALLSWDLRTAVEESRIAVAKYQAIGNRMGVILALARIALANYILGEVEDASAAYTEALALSEESGETWGRSTVLWIRGVMDFDAGNLEAAQEAMRDSLRIRHSFEDRLGAAQCIEVLAWIAASREAFEPAARLLGVVHALWTSTGGRLFPQILDRDQRCRDDIEQAIGARRLSAALEEGTRMGVEDGTLFALGAQAPAPVQAAISRLTPREQQVAELVAEGLSNRTIAAQLVISQRTAEAHVEHILTKLGFNARAQIAAWVAEHRNAPL